MAEVYKLSTFIELVEWLMDLHGWTTLSVGEFNDKGVMHVISADGIFEVEVRSLEHVMEMLASLVMNGNNFTYRMEGKPEDWHGDGIKFHITEQGESKNEH